MVRGAEIDDKPADVEILHRVERFHEAFARRIGARAAYRFAEDLGSDVGLQ